MRIVRFFALSFFAAPLLVPAITHAVKAADNAQSTIPGSALIQPAALAEMLRGGGAPPVILQVGFHILYSEAHIPAAQYAGPTAKQDGIQNLKKHADGVRRDQLVVIYCRCCPWSHCPNIATAYEQLRAMGFVNVKALYLANNFGDDWVNKGYPVVRGE